MYIQRCSIQPSHRALRPDSRPNFEKRCHIIPVPVKTILKVLYAAVFKGTTSSRCEPFEVEHRKRKQIRF